MPGPAGRRPAGRVRRWLRRAVVGLLVLPMLAVLFAGTVVVVYLAVSVPVPDDLGLRATVLVDVHGEEIASLSPEAAREDVELDDLPDHVVDAVLAAEDAGYYDHPGVSLAGVVRAAAVNLARRQVVQGGSTITQQYVKNVTADAEQTLMRKLRESVIAMKLEREHDKDEILELYLNTVYWGRGAYGIEAASQAYFDRPASTLERDEAALLAALLPAPSRLDPERDPEAAERRYEHVLQRMDDEGMISRADRARLAAEVPATVDRIARVFHQAPHFTAAVERELVDRLGEERLHRGLVVETSLDLGLQRAAEQARDEHFGHLDEQAAVVLVDNDTGDVRAYVGGDFAVDQVDYVRAERQSGSTFKTFALAAWVEDGKSPETVFPAPATVTVPVDGGADWRPRNYGNAAYGPMTLREATWRSVNTVYAQLTEEVPPERVADVAHRLGVDSELGAEPSIVLGSREVSPLGMADAYSTLAADGVRRPARTITRVTRGDVELIGDEVGEQRAVSEQVARTTTSVLEGVISSGTGTAAAIGRPAAGKTGTTNRNADAWFAGYTPDYTAVVWMGNRDGNEPMPSGSTGGGPPARAWADLMREAHEGLEPRAFPEPVGALQVVEHRPDCPDGQVAERDADGFWQCVEDRPSCPDGLEPVRDDDGAWVCPDDEDDEDDDEPDEPDEPDDDEPDEPAPPDQPGDPDPGGDDDGEDDDGGDGDDDGQADAPGEDGAPGG